MGKANFNDIIKQDHPVIVDFYADWCGPCKMMSPVLQQVKNEVGDGVTIVKIDIDRNREIAEKFEIRSIPTFMLFKDGEMKWKHVGMVSGADLKNKIVENA